MFEGFQDRTLRVGPVDFFVKLRDTGGPVLLLLHGFPQTYVTWHKLVPLLDKSFTLVCPDLPGYGASTADKGYDFSKRAMADSLIGLMDELGFSSWTCIGHDRGARVAYRMALDHGERLHKLVVLDIIPTANMWTLIDRQSAVADFHWTLLAQPHPIPERLFGSDTDFLVNTLIDRWAGDPKKINAFARQAYLKAYWRPEALRGAIEDYRAGSTLDFEHDRADQEAGRKIACPVLALWAESNEVGPECSPIEVWKDWAEAVEGAPIRESGHFLQEEAPETVARHLADFL